MRSIAEKSHARSDLKYRNAFADNVLLDTHERITRRGKEKRGIILLFFSKRCFLVVFCHNVANEK